MVQGGNVILWSGYPKLYRNVLRRHKEQPAPRPLFWCSVNTGDFPGPGRWRCLSVWSPVVIQDPGGGHMSSGTPNHCSLQVVLHVGHGPRTQLSSSRVEFERPWGGLGRRERGGVGRPGEQGGAGAPGKERDQSPAVRLPSQPSKPFASLIDTFQLFLPTALTFEMLFFFLPSER